MSESRGKRCCKLFLLDWHYSKLSFFHHDWKAFAYTPWLPYKWPFQLIYLAYRWILALYFLAWLITSGVRSGNIFLVYLTNWAFITYNMYLTIAALSVTTKFISVHFMCRPEEEEFSHKCEIKTMAPSGCCGYSDNNISWYQMFQWFFFVIGNEIAFVILILYWSLIFSGERIDGINANTHLVNGIFSLVDFWVSGTPINTLHVIYPMIYGAVYALFTGLYFVGSRNIIYTNALDYNNNVGFAVGVCIMAVFVIMPLTHFVIFYLQCKAKVGIMYCIFGRHHDDSLRNKSNDKREMDENVV